MDLKFSSIKVFSVSALCALWIAPLVVGCGDSDSDQNNNTVTQQDAATGQDAAAQQDAATGQDASPPTGHTENLSGHFHMPGKEDPLSSCTSCHGSSLQGGGGPSCYDCHNNDDHTVNRNGDMHLSGSSSTCSTCHGPSNSGGIGPACSDCH